MLNRSRGWGGEAGAAGIASPKSRPGRTGSQSWWRSASGAAGSRHGPARATAPARITWRSPAGGGWAAGEVNWTGPPGAGIQRRALAPAITGRAHSTERETGAWQNHRGGDAADCNATGTGTATAMPGARRGCTGVGCGWRMRGGVAKGEPNGCLAVTEPAAGSAQSEASLALPSATGRRAWMRGRALTHRGVRATGMG